MSRIALLSDVHGNLQALQRVRRDVAQQGIERMVCLGDLASYNADQHACMEYVVGEKIEWIAGNHDLIAAGLLNPVRCGPQARYSASKARRAMTAAWRRHIRQLPLILADDVFAGFHASPRRVDEYLLSEPRVRSAFAVLQARGLPDVAFFAHTHHSCVWTLRGAVLERREGQRLALDPGGRHLVNVGTVGEPRDGSPLATYVVYDPDARTVEFRRLEYDHHVARQRSESGGWRRVDPAWSTRLYDRLRRRAVQLRSRLLPLPADDSALEAIRRRQERLLGQGPAQGAGCNSAADL
jgi:predicted phosphodiesterase